MPKEGLDEDIEERVLHRVQTIVRAMLDLDAESRLRVHQTVGTFFGIENQSPPTPSTQSTDSSAMVRPNPEAFLLDKQPATDVERVACLAYYLKEFREIPHFKTIDINKLNTEAGQAKFSDASAVIDKATAADLIVSAGSVTRQISTHGERYVEALPDRAAAKAATAGRPPKRQRKASKAPKDVAVK